MDVCDCCTKPLFRSSCARTVVADSRKKPEIDNKPDKRCSMLLDLFIIIYSIIQFEIQTIPARELYQQTRQTAS